MRTKTQFRAFEREDLAYRALTLAADTVSPKTIDAEKRSHEAVLATENPVPVFDFTLRRVVPEVLLMSGVRGRMKDSVPLLDTHDRFSAESVLGSVRHFRVEDGRLVGTVTYSSVPRASEAFTKVREGHLTDYSIGYRVHKATWVQEGATQKIAGRTFEGPVRVVTDWDFFELSVTPVGADKEAKARSANTMETLEKERSMKWRNLLVKLGMKAEATEEEARAFMTSHGLTDAHLEVMSRALADDPAPEPKGIDDPGRLDSRSAVVTASPGEDEIRKRAREDERKRISEIRSMGQHLNMPDVADGAVNSGADLDRARQMFIEKLVKSDNMRALPSVEIVAEQREKFRSVAMDALFVRSGIKVEKPADGHREFVGFSLREIARECLRNAGQNAGGGAMDMVGRALTTSDFPHLLADVAKKSMLDGFGEVPEETWRAWTGKGNLSDFKPSNIIRTSEFDDLEEIKEDGEYKFGKITDKKESVQLGTYGKVFTITRKAILNDDLGGLTEVPKKMGEAASRKIGDVVYAVFLANAAMDEDNVALFHASHTNLLTEAGLDDVKLGKSVKQMKLQKDLQGKAVLGLRPMFFIAPTALEVIAEKFFRSMVIGTEAQPNIFNVFGGSYFTRVYEARLDADSAVKYYLAAAKGKTVNVYFLNGVETPMMEQQSPFMIDGVSYKIRIDVAAKAVDYRGLQQNTAG